MQRARAELLAHRARHRLADARGGAELVALHRDVVLAHVDDAPLDERVDQHRAVALGEEAQRIGVVVGEDAHVEVAHVLQQRPLEVQPRAVDHFLHLAELEHDRVLALIDGEHRARGDEREHRDDGDDGPSALITGRPFPDSSGSRASAARPRPAAPRARRSGPRLPPRRRSA